MLDIRLMAGAGGWSPPTPLEAVDALCQGLAVGLAKVARAVERIGEGRVIIPVEVIHIVFTSEFVIDHLHESLHSVLLSASGKVGRIGDAALKQGPADGPAPVHDAVKEIISLAAPD